MAISNNNILLQQLSGSIGKQLIIKQYANKTVVTAYPKRSKKKKQPSEAQKLAQEQFKAAVKYAREILKDPEKKKLYENKVKKGQLVYHYLISEYKVRAAQEAAK
jgi:hypothetical protein